MRIGFIGAGRMGGTLATLLARAGHHVLVSNSRGPESLGDLVAEAGPHAEAVTAADAAKLGEIVIITLPWGRSEALPKPDAVAGKIVVDAMNAFGRAGGHSGAGKPTTTEQTAAALPEARVVKAFNTLNFELMRAAAGRSGDTRLSLFVAGDNAAAKQVVADLMNDMGFAAIDTGTLADGGRLQQPGSRIFNKQLTETAARKLVPAASP
jgi:hypothetical protein